MQRDSFSEFSLQAKRSLALRCIRHWRQVTLGKLHAKLDGEPHITCTSQQHVCNTPFSPPYAMEIPNL